MKMLAEINEIIVKQMGKILEDIAEAHNLNVSELKEKYLGQNSDLMAEKKKRGRKKKQKDEMIETVEVEYEGSKYLVDSQNNVYTNNVNAPALVGERLVDGTIKFSKKNDTT